MINSPAWSAHAPARAPKCVHAVSVITIVAAVTLPAWSGLVCSVTVAQENRRPNILLILADDLGWSDIACYGGEIPTPEIDALAAQGLRFTQCYNAGRCCPTRASLLTGLYPHQAGIGHMTQFRQAPGYEGRLNQSCRTLGEALGEAGYFTAICGKWHVGHQQPSNLPLQRGFERFFGVPEGGGFYFRPTVGRTLMDGNQVVATAESPLPQPWYSTDAWALHAIGFINESLETGRPFFLYLAHNAPHFPLQAPAADIARFRGKFRAGWDQLRRERFARQRAMGLVGASWSLSQRPPEAPAWDTFDSDAHDRFDQIMAVYAAVLSRWDRSIGLVVDALRERDMLQNTVILVLSDNGASAESGVQGRLEGAHPGDADSSVYQGQCWATLSNTPWRQYKSFTHEGGIATPLIAHWPAGIPPSLQGALIHDPVHVIDIMPTLLALAGSAPPTAAGTNSDDCMLPLEGVSLLPTWSGGHIRRGQPLFWEHEGNRAIRDGEWKLTARGPGGPWDLYHLGKDRTETENLVEQYPDRARGLAVQWEAWAQRTGVLPWIWSPPYHATDDAGMPP